MSFWENLALAIFNQILAEIKFDPTKHATLAKVLTPIRDELLILYPLNPPAPPAQIKAA